MVEPDSELPTDVETDEPTLAINRKRQSASATPPRSDPTIVAAAPVVPGATVASALGSRPPVVGATPSAVEAGPGANPAAALVRAHGLFRRESLEAHLAAARDAEVLRVAPPWSRAVFALCTSLIVGALVLACLFDIEQTGFAKGILRVAGGVQTLTAQAAGTVLEVGSRSGEVVNAGSVLVRIDSAQTRSSLIEAERQIQLAEQKLADFKQRREKVHGQRVRLLEQNAGLLARRADKQEETVRRSRSKQQTFRSLVKEGLTSELQKNDVEDELAAAERDLLRMREEYTQTKLQIANIAAELDTEESKLAAELQQAKDRREALSVQLTQTEVRAPRGGRLEAMLVKTGDAVSVGAPVGKLVPVDAPRQVVVFVAERDRAFLVEGAEARIEFDQFPVGEFGTLPGKVTRIASDLASPAEISEALGDMKLNDPVFRVELTLKPDASLDRIEPMLRPGSVATARFALRQRRIITVLFEPLKRFFA
jgi:multidrug resistance efflux pump